jgi:hypothetical protein
MTLMNQPTYFTYPSRIVIVLLLRHLLYHIRALTASPVRSRLATRSTAIRRLAHSAPTRIVYGGLTSPAANVTCQAFTFPTITESNRAVVRTCRQELMNRGILNRTLRLPTILLVVELFDAIILGEVAHRKWLAGSDFFRRTQQEQTNLAVEKGSRCAVTPLGPLARGLGFGPCSTAALWSIIWTIS